MTVGNIQVTVESSGKVAAQRAANLTYQTSGTVTAVLIKAGDVVPAGQTLVRLDDTTLKQARAPKSRGVLGSRLARILV